METSSTPAIPINIASELAAVARSFYAKGWAPATSTNYSARLPLNIRSDELRVIISRSGIDKSVCLASDMLLVNGLGQKIQTQDGRPSAETPLHVALYNYSQDIGAVVHSHSVVSTVLSRIKAKEGKVIFAGLEMLKGLAGVETHETSQFIPIFPNTQDMTALGRDVVNFLLRQEEEGRADKALGIKKIYGVLIEGHGLYSWGEDIFAAKRHAEVYEFLFECFMYSREVIQ